MGRFSKDREFWLIFDTSQYPKYYRDVHDLLAAPNGYVLRYQYRDEHFSQRALANTTQKWTLPILFAYAQKNTDYRREEGKSLPVNDKVPTLFVLTRAGKMLNIVKEAGKIYLDFQVVGYPDNAKAIDIKNVLDPLIAKKEVPWDKWAVISENYEAFVNICTGADEDNWRQIVELLGQSPIQFADDAFWRLKGPFTKSGNLIKPNLRRVRQNSEVRRVASEYLLKENSFVHLQLVTSVPKVIKTARPNYSVAGKVSGSEKLKLIGSGTYELRHYDEQPIEYATQEMNPFRTEASDLTLLTTPTAETWTAGAKLDIRQNIRKSHWISVFGVLSGAAGLALAALGGSKLFENDALNGVIILASGLLLLTAAKYMLTGKLEFGK